MQEKILLVLGASSDIGIAFIGTEIQKYDYIIAHYNSNERALLQLKEKYPEKIYMKRADFSKKENVERFIEEVFQEGKIPSYVIHFPAAKCKLRQFAKVPIEDFQRNMQISVNSIILILQRLLPFMAKQHYGKIVFVLSIHMTTGIQKYISDYIMTKFALFSLMKSLTIEYKDKGIHINSVSPDMVATKFISELPELAVENKKNGNVTKKLLEVSDVVPTISFLLDGTSDCLYGQNIEIS